MPSVYFLISIEVEGPLAEWILLRTVGRMTPKSLRTWTLKLRPMGSAPGNSEAISQESVEESSVILKPVRALIPAYPCWRLGEDSCFGALILSSRVSLTPVSSPHHASYVRKARDSNRPPLSYICHISALIPTISIRVLANSTDLLFL